MGEGFGALALGLWFGFSAPIAIHVGVLLLQREPTSSALSWIIRLVAAPAALLGLLGIAAAIGLYQGLANWAALGVLAGFAVYCLCAWVNHKRSKSGAIRRHGT